MTEALLIAIVVLAIINVILILRKRIDIDIKPQMRELEDSIIKFSTSLEHTNKSIKDEFQRIRTETNDISKANREELSKSLKSFEEKFSKNTKDLNDLLRQKFADFSNLQTDIHKQSIENLKDIRETIEKQLKAIREDNSQRLEEMRKTVDEKLQTTLEKRIGESFKQVSEKYLPIYLSR